MIDIDQEDLGHTLEQSPTPTQDENRVSYNEDRVISKKMFVFFLIENII
jgi:hypothetical protein